MNAPQTRCPLCGSTAIRRTAHPAAHVCTDCEFQFRPPAPGSPGVNPAFPPENPGILSLLHRRKIFSGRVLVVHASTGLSLKGFEVEPSGIDPRAPASLTEEALSALPAGRYDVCLAGNILEYLPDPAGFLQRLHRSLAPDALLILQGLSLDLPPGDASDARVSVFTRQTIHNLLLKAGFEKIRRYDGINCVAAHRTQRSAAPVLSVILPAFNERRTFTSVMELLLARELKGVRKEIVVVESNSADGTRGEVLKYRDRPGVKIVLEDKPQGKGHAVRTGLAHAQGDFILIQDADLEYDIGDYDKLLDPLLRFQSTFVLGSRHAGSWQMRHFEDQRIIPFIMNSGHMFFTLLINIFCGSHLKDPFTMYKVFHRDCLSGLSFSADRFDFDWEIIIKFLRKGYIPREIPVSYSSRSFKEGKKIRFFYDPLLWMRALLRYRFERLFHDA